MSDRIFVVEVTVSRTVRVRIPDDIVNDGETHKDVAEEIGLGGRESWPEYVLSEEDDTEVDSVREVKA